MYEHPCRSLYSLIVNILLYINLFKFEYDFDDEYYQIIFFGKRILLDYIFIKKNC